MNEEKGRKLPEPYEFSSNMSPVQRTLGWIYLPMQMFAFPILLPLLALYYPGGLSDGDVQILYYAIGAVFSLTVMYTFLRRDFDVLLDAPLRCLMVLVSSYAISYLLSLALSAVMLALGMEMDNPNNSAIAEIAEHDYGKMKAAAVFMAPIVEEILFRGVVFSSLKRRRIPAYVVSTVLFSLYHVWPYAFAGQSPALLLYGLQYIPLSYALARAYERSGSIWTSVFLHMFNNVVAFRVLELT